MGDYFKPPAQIMQEQWAARIAANSPLSAFLTELRHVAAPTPEFVRAAAPLLQRLLESDFLCRLINSELDDLVRQPEHVTPDAFVRTWSIASEPHFSFSVRIFPAKHQEDPTLGTLSHDALIGVAGPTRLPLSLYRCASGEAHAAPARIEPSRQVSLSRGECVFVEAGREIYSILPHEGTVVGCILGGASRIDRIHVFDTASREHHLSAAANLLDSRAEIAARVLGRYRYRPALPTLEGMLAHPSHFVRWSVLQQIARIAPSCARHHLDAALQDPHPHIRRAAAATLGNSGDRHGHHA